MKDRRESDYALPIAALAHSCLRDRKVRKYMVRTAFERRLQKCGGCACCVLVGLPHHHPMLIHREWVIKLETEGNVRLIRRQRK